MIPTRRLAIAALVALLCAGAADPKPVLRPTRDVDITYSLGSEHGRVLRERLRWDAVAQRLRVDPPTDGLYVIVDLPTRRMSMVRSYDRTVIDSPAPAGIAGPPDSAAAGAVRQGDDMIAGLACTNWALKDDAGEATTVCLTVDGVMLRAQVGGRTLLSATEVHYGAIDPVAFEIPDGYKRAAP